MAGKDDSAGYTVPYGVRIKAAEIGIAIIPSDNKDVVVSP